MKVSRFIAVFAAGSIAVLASQAMAAGDAAKGEKVARKCKACHTLNEGGKNSLGPNLYGVLGRASGQAEGYKYSKAMVGSGIVWEEHTFDDFIKQPKKVVPGTKMSFGGIKKATQRADLIAYFQTLRGEGVDPALVQGDAAEGSLVAEKNCIVCHSFEEGGKVVFGPNLFGIAGQPAAAIEGFRYSDALTNSGLEWNDSNLVGFLANPDKFVPGTTARFPGLKTAKERADILAYIKTLQ